MCIHVLELVRNLVAHGDAGVGKWRGNWRMEWVASILTPPPNVDYPADAYTSAASSRLNWRPHRFKWTHPFWGKTKSGFCACAITFRTSCMKASWDLGVLTACWWGFGSEVNQFKKTASKYQSPLILLHSITSQMICIFISHFYLMPLLIKMMEEWKVKCGNYFRIFDSSVTCEDKYKNHYICWKIRPIFHLCNLIPHFIYLRAVYCVVLSCWASRIIKFLAFFIMVVRFYVVLECNAVFQGVCVCMCVLFVMNIIKVYFYWHFSYDIICIFYG